MPPRIARLAALAITIVAAGCGGGGGHSYAIPDAVRIARTAPASPGWTWPPSHAPDVDTDQSQGAVSDEPLVAELQRRLSPLHGSGEVSNRWEDADKLANLDLSLFDSEQDARRAMTAVNAFSLAYGRQTGTVRSHGPVEDLGDEGWVLRVEGNGTQVTYHWRRENLLVEAHIHCFGSCPADVDAAARAWAEKLDAGARTVDGG